MCQYIDGNIGADRINSYAAKQESYILQGHWEHRLDREDNFVTAGSEVPGGLGAGPWL